MIPLSRRLCDNERWAGSPLSRRVSGCPMEMLWRWHSRQLIAAGPMWWRSRTSRHGRLRS